MEKLTSSKPYYYALLFLIKLTFVHRCEKRGYGQRGHLVIRNLNEFNLEYLQALLTDSLDAILQFESAALSEGYGLLAPCTYISALQEQKRLCRKFNSCLSKGNCFLRVLQLTGTGIKTEFSVVEFLTKLKPALYNLSFTNLITWRRVHLLQQ